MTDNPRKSLPTIVGLPRLDEADPFPLTPYRDVMTVTPSHSRPLRERGESTPVHIPPARRLTPAEMKRRDLDRTRLHMPRCNERDVRIDPWDIALAAALVCFVLLVGALVL
jgi:hypothetical protein